MLESSQLAQEIHVSFGPSLATPLRLIRADIPSRTPILFIFFRRLIDRIELSICL